LKLPSSQILALFNKTMRKLHSQLHGAAAREIEAALPRVREVKMTAHDRTVDEDLDEAAADVQVNPTGSVFRPSCVFRMSSHNLYVTQTGPLSPNITWKINMRESVAARASLMPYTFSQICT
jgi:hypothetical protein